jgi:hypothetical protein
LGRARKAHAPEPEALVHIVVEAMLLVVDPSEEYPDQGNRHREESDHPFGDILEVDQHQHEGDDTRQGKDGSDEHFDSEELVENEPEGIGDLHSTAPFSG